MANRSVLLGLLLVIMVLVGAEATPPGIANNPSHASCNIKKYKHCYNLAHVCPKFCPSGCTVECASCKPICASSSSNPTPSTPDYSPSPPSDSTPATPSTPDQSPPSSSTPSTPSTPDYSPSPSTPTTPSTPDQSPPSSSTPTAPSTPDPSPPPSASTPTPSKPDHSPPPPSTPSTPSTPDSPPPSTPSTPSTPDHSPPSPSTPSTPSTPDHSPPPSTPTTPSTPDHSPPPPSTPTTPSIPDHSPPPPSTPSTPSTPDQSPPSPSTPSTTPSTPDHSPPSPSTPTSPSTPDYSPPSPSTPTTPSTPDYSPPPSTPSTPSTPNHSPPSPSTPSTPSTPDHSPSPPSNPSTPSTPSSSNTARCKNKNSTKCYNIEHTCPAACPTGCDVDCDTCKPICKCDKPGAVCQDPRFVGGDGITFYFHGKKDSNFCLVSDPNLHINAHFIGKRNPTMTRDFTWVQSIAILFNNHHIVVAAQKTASWNDHVDRLALTFDGKPISLYPSEASMWRSNTALRVTITRLSETNYVVVEIEGRVRITAKVVPITEEDSRIHNYGISEEDCFAHLDLGFKFMSLSDQVSGVLGQTYRPDYVSRVNIKAKMPVMGGDKEFKTTSLFVPDCSVSRFSDNDVDDDGLVINGGESALMELPGLSCASGIDGQGVVCKR